MLADISDSFEAPWDWKEMTNWFTSDSHLGHFRINLYAKRPFISKELQALYAQGHKPHSELTIPEENKCLKLMNETLVNNWNERVKPEDTVYHLGDLCFTKHICIELLMESLHGKIVLILGNHDHKGKHSAIRYFKDHPEKGICHKALEMKIGKYHCLLSHRPLYNKYENYDPAKYANIICGHVHDRFTFNGKNINVGVDRHDFYPISEKELIELLDEFRH